MNRVQKIAVLALAIAVIPLTMTGCTTASTTGGDAPEIQIMADINGNPIDYVILLNMWNGALYDRAGYREVLHEMIGKGGVQVSNIEDLITFDFGANPPDSMVLKVDYDTNPLISYSVRPVPQPVSLNNMSFAHPARPAGYPENAVRFYVLTCAWGQNEAEYAFALKVQGGFPPLSEEIDWIEISPEMGLTTYVDEREIVSQIVDLFSRTELRQATEAEVAQIKISQPNPADMIINGTAYPRNIRLEFISVTNELVSSHGTVHLFGDFVNINGQFYIPFKALTNEFILILDELHQQGKGRSSTQKLALTMEAVRALAAGEITATELVQTYEGRSVTSGIYSYYSELPDDYALMIGFGGYQSDPWYMRLIDTITEDYIDLETDSIDDFLVRRKTQ